MKKKHFPTFLFVIIIYLFKFIISTFTSLLIFGAGLFFIYQGAISDSGGGYFIGICIILASLFFIRENLKEKSLIEEYKALYKKGMKPSMNYVESEEDLKKFEDRVIKIIKKEKEKESNEGIYFILLKPEEGFNIKTSQEEPNSYKKVTIKNGKVKLISLLSES